MIRYFVLFLMIIRQGFSGEFTGADKIDLKIFLPTEEKGELTGASLPTDPVDEILVEEIK